MLRRPQAASPFRPGPSSWSSPPPHRRRAYSPKPDRPQPGASVLWSRKHFLSYEAQRARSCFCRNRARFIHIIQFSCPGAGQFFYCFSHSSGWKPTSTRSPSTRIGRLTSIPSVASRVSCSSSVMSFRRSLRPRALYNCPEVLKNFFSGSPLAFHHAFSSSRVGRSSLMSRGV